jgi:multicomponent Na+:H+ antiporter subunit B
MLVFIAGGNEVLGRLAPERMVELAEAGGALGFALIGLGGLVFAATFFENFFALGTQGSLLSGGTIPLSNLVVGLEVTGALVLIFSEFLEETRSMGGE